MFGEELEGALEIGGSRIELARFGDRVLYRRLRGGAVEREILTKGEVLRLLPLPTVFYPRHLTRYVLCHLSTPVHVPPGEAVGFYTLLPVDAAVYGFDVRGGSFGLLDVVPLQRVYKYAVYGPLSRYGDVGGLIARYVRVAVLPERPAWAEEPGFCLSYVEVLNESGRFATVTRLLLDASPLSLFYEPGSWRCCTQRARMSVTGPSTAVVSYEEEPVEQGFKKAEEPEETKDPLVQRETRMLWGY